MAPDALDQRAAAFASFLAAVRAAYDAEAAGGGDAGAAQGALARALAGLVARPAAAAAATLPVCRHLDRALAQAEAGPLQALGRTFRPLAEVAAWRQNPNYTPAAVGAGFLDGYGYAEIVGPAGAIVSASVAVGVLLLGPGTLYPEHHHPAAEVYHVLAGTGDWCRDGGPWLARPPGSVVYHPPHMPHAMRAGDEPMLLLYGWQGEVTTAARLGREPAGRPG